MTGSRNRKSRRRWRSALVWLITFAVVCGVVLLLVGPRPDGQLQGVASETRKRLTVELVGLLTEVQQAERAIHETDYGKARRQIGRVRSGLSRLLAEINEVTRKEGGEVAPQPEAKP